MKKLKIIFVGIPDMALVCLCNLLEKNFDIIGVVPPLKTHETYTFFKNFVKSKGLNFLEFENSPNDSDYIEKIKNLNADIGIVCSYNMLFSKEFLATTKMGYINCHPSLLPNYRGPAPYFHIINNGERISGITLHFMDEKFDTGDIIFQQKFNIMPYETMGSLFNRTTYMLSDALIETLQNIEKGIELQRTPQDKNKPYIEATKVDGNFRIRWNKDVYELERLIRASNPFYNVFTNFRGTSFKIIKAQALETKHNLKFGEILKTDENSLIIAAQNGALSVEIAQIGTWGVYIPKDFYYTFTPKTGEIFA